MMSDDQQASRIAENLDKVRQRILDACGRFGRNPDEVRLLAVSKTKSATMIGEAIRAGQRHFGENYLQEALEKIDTVRRTDITWHFIGAIQSNKTRSIAAHFAWVHTVASARVARRLSNQAPGPLNVLIQVNVTGEGTKAGIDPGDLSPLLESMIPLENLRVRGLMTIPAPHDDLESQRRPFRALRELLEQARGRFGGDLKGFDQLSMGMTADLEAAVAEGATWLRIGTAIFGQRT